MGIVIQKVSHLNVQIHLNFGYEQDGFGCTHWRYVTIILCIFLAQFK